MTMPRTFKNFISGKWVDAKSGKTFENRNPAHWDKVLGTFPKSGKEDVDAAVKAATGAFDAWRLLPAPKRGEILKRVGDLMVARKEELARAMTMEMGKVLAETMGDVQEGIDTAYYAASETGGCSDIPSRPSSPISSTWRCGCRSASRAS